ncbi:MAG: hypothetical protein DCC68_21305 [Planctomycetota bacterium]|nr:MAG: hypothetical protein DCC68_21305 [Planctomycetota bacterium]
MTTARKGRKPKELSPGFTALKAALVDQPAAAESDRKAAEMETGRKIARQPWHVVNERPFRTLFNRVVGTLATSRDYGDWPEGDRLRQMMFDSPDEYSREVTTRWKTAFGVDPPMSWTDWVRLCGVAGIIAPDAMTEVWIETRVVPYIVGRFRGANRGGCDQSDWIPTTKGKMKALYKVTSNTIAARIKSGKIRVKELDKQNILVHPDDYSAAVRAKEARDAKTSRN